jgi:ABC-type transporter Mla MlaB component
MSGLQPLLTVLRGGFLAMIGWYAADRGSPNSLAAASRTPTLVREHPTDAARPEAGVQQLLREQEEKIFAVLAERGNGKDRLLLVGQLDRLGVTWFVREEDGLVEPARFVLDLRDVSLVDTYGLAALKELLERAVQDGSAVRLMNVRASVLVAFESAGLGQLLIVDEET